MSRRVNRRRDGHFDLTLEPAEIELIRELPEQLRALYEGDRDDRAAVASSPAPTSTPPRRRPSPNGRSSCTLASFRVASTR